MPYLYIQRKKREKNDPSISSILILIIVFFLFSVPYLYTLWDMWTFSSDSTEFRLMELYIFRSMYIIVVIIIYGTSLESKD